MILNTPECLALQNSVGGTLLSMQFLFILLQTEGQVIFGCNRLSVKYSFNGGKIQLGIQYTTRLREAKRGEEEKTEKWTKVNRRNEME